MSTDAGKRFLEATPIAVGFERQALRHSVAEGAGALLVIGTVVLMPGLGFIISAGITWALARHLGLMPDSGAKN